LRNIWSMLMGIIVIAVVIILIIVAIRAIA
jgi:hypothetical protein